MTKPLRPAACGTLILATALAASSPLLPRDRVSAATIEFTEMRLDRPGSHAFRLTLAAKGDGIEVGSYGLRTYERGSGKLPGFVDRNGYRYLASSDSPAKAAHILLDGGPDDENASPGVCSVTVDTRGWPDGDYLFLAYADKRPAPGPYVTARSLVYVVIAGGKLTRAWTKSLRMTLADFRVEPAEVEPGESFRVSAVCEDSEPDDMEFALTCPYTVGPEEVPPGFRYDAEEKQCWFKTRRPDGSFLVSTKGWKPGVYHLTLLAGWAVV